MIPDLDIFPETCDEEILWYKRKLMSIPPVSGQNQTTTSASRKPSPDDTELAADQSRKAQEVPVIRETREKEAAESSQEARREQVNLGLEAARYLSSGPQEKKPDLQASGEPANQPAADEGGGAAPPETAMPLVFSELNNCDNESKDDTGLPGKAEENQDEKVQRATRPFAHDNEFAQALKTEYKEKYEEADALRDRALKLAAESGDGADLLPDGRSVKVNRSWHGTVVISVEGQNGTREQFQYDEDDPVNIEYERTSINTSGDMQGYGLKRDGTTLTETESWRVGLSNTRWRSDVFTLGNPYGGEVQGPSHPDEIELSSSRFSGFGEPGVDGIKESAAHVTQYGSVVLNAGFAPNVQQALNESEMPPVLAETPLDKSYKERLFEKYNFDDQAAEILRTKVPLVIEPLDNNVKGGGIFHANKGEIGYVSLNGLQEEAGIHEFSHAWYQHQLIAGEFDSQRQAQFQAEVKSLADDSRTPAHLLEIARFFTYGECPDGTMITGAGLEDLQHNTSEMYASFASGVMADYSSLPECLKPYYADLFSSADRPASDGEIPPIH